MNTKPNDGATARPWTIEDWIHEHERLSDEITRLVNEREALLAVAEAAEHLDKEMRLAFDEVPPGVDAWLATVRAKLAALRARREP